MLREILAKIGQKLTKPILMQRSSIQSGYEGISIKDVKYILQNEILDELIPLYYLMLQRDLHLASEINKRKMQLLTIPYKIEGNKKEFVQKILDDENTDYFTLFQELTSAIPYGFSIIDLIWDVKEIDGLSYFIPTSFNQISQRFIYSDSGEKAELGKTLDHLYMYQNSKKKLIKSFDPRKFLIHLHKTDTGHITDYALLYKVAWFVVLKHSAISNNMNYFDTLGVPPLIVNYNSDSSDEINYILNQALSLKSNSVGVFPKEAVLSTIEGKGTKADFMGFIDYCDKNISHYILGNTLAGDNSQGGSYALGKVHENIKEQYRAFDARLYEKTFTSFLNRILEMNFKDEKVKFSFILEASEDLEKLSVVYKNLTDSGFVIPAEHISKVFNIPNVGKKEIEPNSKKFNSKSKILPTDKIEAEINNLDTKKIDNNIKKIVDSLILKANSYEEVYQNILKNYPDIDIKDMEEVLSSYIANSNLQGFIDAD